MITSSTISFGVLLGLSSLVASAEDWPHWRGPNGNGISSETNWQAEWPQEGPKRLWKASVGTGFSSFAVSRGRVYTMGNTKDTDTVFCLDTATGTNLWKHSYPCPLAANNFEGGPAATPTVEGDRVYTFSRSGDLFCLEAATGKVIWSKNLVKELGAKPPTWGLSSSVLVVGDRIFLNLGASGTALDSQSGKVVWSSGSGPGGYATPVLFKAGGEQCLAVFSKQSIEAVKLADGSRVWSYPWKTSYDVNAADPIISGNEVFISSGYDHGATLLRLAGTTPSKVWQNKNMRNRFSNSVLWQGHLYGVDASQLRCITFDTGEVKWTEPEFGEGSLILADGKLIGLSEKGQLLIAKTSPDGFKAISRTQALTGKCWTPPVLANGRIYCRNAAGDVVCLDVSGKKGVAIN